MGHREVISNCEMRIANLARPHSSYAEVGISENNKSQNPNNKQLTMTEIQNPKRSRHL